MGQLLFDIPKAGDRPIGADIDPSGAYRYDLRRSWGVAPFRVVNWIMLNPSTADATEDDPTIRRCLGFAKAWGFGGIVVTNLFAFRATDPREMRRAPDPIGPANDDYLRRWAGGADLVVAAWGTHGVHRGRDGDVLRMLDASGIPVNALKVSAGGHPCHPLYLRGDLAPRPLRDLR